MPFRRKLIKGLFKGVGVVGQVAQSVVAGDASVSVLCAVWGVGSRPGALSVCLGFSGLSSLPGGSALQRQALN